MGNKGSSPGKLLPSQPDPDYGLAPYAVQNSEGLGRMDAKYGNKPNEWRTRFRIDSGRINHSDAFRRLRKAQVYSLLIPTEHPLNDRMSHTVEVASCGRDFARLFHLNPDLTEAMALGHDLGHCAFGHEGENGLHAWCKDQGIAFDHNQHTQRIIRLLENHVAYYRGLNLNLETVEGLEKVPTVSAPACIPVRGRTMESQLLHRTEDVSYTVRDIEDGMNLGILREGDVVQHSRLYREAERYAKSCSGSTRSSLLVLFARDLHDNTQERLRDLKIRTLNDVYLCTHPIVLNSPNMCEDFQQLSLYLRREYYQSLAKAGYTRAARAVMIALCNFFSKNSSGDVVRYTKLAEEAGENHAETIGVRDYVASLTDLQAYVLAQRIEVPKNTLKKLTEIPRL